MTFNLKPHEIEAYLILLDKKLSANFQQELLADLEWDDSEQLALKLAFDIAKKTLEQFPRLKKQLLLEKEKIDD
ncbi:MAG: hypothetical protein IM607_07780 [Cytophagales bacterium]|nr:hypothetical protein [Cytophagales bacterium]